MSSSAESLVIFAGFAFSNEKSCSECRKPSKNIEREFSNNELVWCIDDCYE